MDIVYVTPVCPAHKVELPAIVPAGLGAVPVPGFTVMLIEVAVAVVPRLSVAIALIL